MVVFCAALVGAAIERRTHVRQPAHRRARGSRSTSVYPDRIGDFEKKKHTGTRAPLSITRLKAVGWYRRPLGCHYGWYNTERIQNRLGWRSPDQYEAAWHAGQGDHPAAHAAEPDPAAAR